MIYRLEVFSIVADMRAQVRIKAFAKLISVPISSLTIADVYTIEGIFTKNQLEKIVEMLVNPVSQSFRLLEENGKASTEKNNFDWVIETGFLPGVTDNVATTVGEMIADGVENTTYQVYTSQLTYLSGNFTAEDIQTVSASLYNPLIQRVSIKSAQQYAQAGRMDFIIPRVKLETQSQVDEVDLDVSDQELTLLGKSGISNPDGTRRGPLALDLLSLKTIRDYFEGENRNPTDIELESIAQTWSEHCKHTIFANPIADLPDGLFRSYIKRATDEIRSTRGQDDICVSVFTDNSGAIAFDDDYLITDKVETHNSPSALDPFGGAITGIVGVNRDALGFGLGAKPILNRYGFCFAYPGDATQLYRDKNKTQPLLSSRRIIDGVVAGVNSGGNCSGIPTTQGFMYFDPRFRGKPLVFVGTLGLIPRKNVDVDLSQKKAQPGDLIVMVGGRVGLDGIHGATFSSEALSSGSPATAVQIGDPITQKKLSDTLVKEARALGLYTSITDNGAGGLSCSVAEMAKECNGCHVVLEKVPLKYPGLDPWQIWISESQERMTLSVPPEKWSQLQSLLAKRGVEATVIGEFNDSGYCTVEYQGKTILNLSLDFLHFGLPTKQLPVSFPYVQQVEPQIPQQKNIADIFQTLLKDATLGSIEQITQQYDHDVQGGSVLKPLQGRGRINADATVVRPVLSSEKGVVVSHALYPHYGDIDTYAMVAAGIDTAIRNAVVAGADPNALALLDNFCWCSSHDADRLGQLKRAAEACYDVAVAFGTPFISGKDSMFNDFNGFDGDGKQIKISIPPTVLISTIGVIADSTKTVSLDAKMPGDLIYVLGETKVELGASAYYRWWAKEHDDGIGNTLPQVNPKKNKQLYEKYHEAVKAGLIASAQSVHHGGLIIALAKMAMGGMLGIDISLKKFEIVSRRSDDILFSESQGRIVVTVAAENQQSFERLFADVAHYHIGTVTREAVIRVTTADDTLIIDTPIKDTLSAYKSEFGILNGVKPSALVLTGYGINCEEETAFAFEQSGVSARIVHISDLISKDVQLSDFEILAFPGGFAYGDDTGSGNAYAHKVKNHLWEDLQEFVANDHLVIGICNGFQILVNLGLLPALEGKYGQREVALLHNETALYTARWVDLAVNDFSPWYKNIKRLSLPIAHGEGKFYATDGILSQLKQKHMIAARYTKGEICTYQKLPANPTGSLDNIAAITDETGRILGMMPHPERAISFTQLPNWPLIREMLHRRGEALPTEGPGLKIFQNAASYFA